MLEAYIIVSKMQAFHFHVLIAKYKDGKLENASWGHHLTVC